jgi:ketosteroid isomerase-like protein
MSHENVEIVRRGFEHFRDTGEPLEEIYAPDFIWDMGTFRDLVGLGEQYLGVEGMRRFLAEWTEPFEDWEIEVESFHEVGDKVVAVCRQTGRSKASGACVEMRLAQVFTVRDGLQRRMEMYADPAEALKAVGLAGRPADRLASRSRPAD